MRKIVCELCDGTEFVKEDGMFICQGCGTKYSTDEAKNMMQDVEDGDSSNKVNSSNSQDEVEKLFILERAARDSGNRAQDEEYCDKILAIDPTNAEA